MGKYISLANESIAAVGGRENVSNVSHCMTRLRFYIKDMSRVNEEELKQVKGVMGVQFIGNEVQAIIGPTVRDVYKDVINVGNFSAMEAIDEKLDNFDEPKKKKITPKSIFSSLMDVFAGCVTPTIPAFIIYGLIRTLCTLFGPGFLGLMTEESSTYRIMYMAADSVTYFLPFFLAYTASKKFETQTVVSLVMAGVLMSPTFLEMTNSGEALSIFGIPITPVSYATTLLPIIFIVIAQKYVEKLYNKIIPEVLSNVFNPVFTVLTLLPIGLCFLGPIGDWIGQGIIFLMDALYNIAGPLETVVIGGLFIFILAFGVGYAPFLLCMMKSIQTGREYLIFPMQSVYTTAMIGLGLAYLIRCKKEDKAMASSSFIALTISSISEPTVYGICFRNKKILLVEIIAAALGSLWLGLFKVAAFPIGFGTIGFLSFTRFVDGTANGVHGCIGSAIAFCVAFIGTWLVCGKDKKEA